MNQPLEQMKAKILLPAMATLLLFACNSAPQATESPAAEPPAAVSPPVDTINDRYERNEVKQIQHDTAKVTTPTEEE